ncbi:Ubiquitin carboxyl-terminal hydrolase bap1 [Podila clonocystis]|nr:Ubiquitin carboxyl-terminal hydrolase bap1 [Podila clonocystis]
MGSLQDPDELMEQALPPLSNLLPLGGDWCTLESSPLVFNALLEKNGVRRAYAQEMYTIDPQDLEQLESDGGQVYGFVMLLDPLKRLSRTVEPESEEESEPEPEEPESVAEISNAVVNGDASTTTAKDEKKKKNKTQLYFANQVIPNACATQAVFSVIMNAPPSLDIGPVLANFKDFVRDFSPMDFRANHNSLAERLEQEPSSLQKHLYNTVMHEVTEEPLHYIAYVPVNGYIWELDGLEPQPIRRRPFGVLNKKEEDGEQRQQQQPQQEEDSLKSWLAVTGEVMSERIRLYPAGEERFVLFAIVKDPLVVLEERLVSARQKAQEFQMERALDQDLEVSPSAADESTLLETPSLSSGDAPSDAVAELKRLIESLKRERKQEKLDIALKTADYWPAINFFLEHLVGEGKVNKKTGKLSTDQKEEEEVPADMAVDLIAVQQDVLPDTVMAADLITGQQEVPPDTDMVVDLISGQQEVPVEAAKPVDTKAPKRRSKKKTETKDLVKVEEPKDEESTKAGVPLALERPVKPVPEDLVPTETSLSKAKGRRRKQKTPPPPPAVELEKDHPMELIQEPLSEPMQVPPVEPVPKEPETDRGKRRRVSVKPFGLEPVPESLATGRGKRTNRASNPFDSASDKKRATSQDPPWSTPPPPPPPQPSSAKKRQAVVIKEPPPRLPSAKKRQSDVTKAPLRSSSRLKKQESTPPVDTEPLGASPDGMEIDESPAVCKEPLESSSSELSSAGDSSDDSDLEPMQNSKDERRPQGTKQQRELEVSKKAEQRDIHMSEASQHDTDPRKTQQEDVDMTEAQSEPRDKLQRDLSPKELQDEPKSLGEVQLLNEPERRESYHQAPTLSNIQKTIPTIAWIEP